MKYIIGSFNLLKMNYRKDGMITKDYKKLAEIINNEDFDVVALQEVFIEGVLKNSLIPALGANKWECCWNTPKPYTSGSNEGYAYIWKKRG